MEQRQGNEEDTKRIHKTCKTGSQVKTQRSEYLLSYKFKGSCSSQVQCCGRTLEGRRVQEIDRKTRKLLTIYRTYHPQNDKDRLYVQRKTGGRGLICVEDAVNTEINSLRTYTDNSEEWTCGFKQKKSLKTHDPI